MSELLSGRGGNANAVVNVATVKFRFGTIVLTEKSVFDKTYEKIGVAGSHFGTHGYTISLFVIVATECKVSVRTSATRRSRVSEISSLTVR